MPDDLTVDPTIRNQRYPGPRPEVWLVAWFGMWLGTAGILEVLLSRAWDKAALLVTGAAILGSFLALLAYLERRPVQRLKLGDELRAFPVGRLKPAEIKEVLFSADEDEDYAEGKPPVPFCAVSVEGPWARRFRLVASAGDAARLREWAERKGIPVVDPQGYSARPTRQ